MLEAIGIAILVLIWVISSLIKGFKWLLRQTNPTPLQAPPSSQIPTQAQSPFQRLQMEQAPPPSVLRPVQGPPTQVSPNQALRQQQAARLEQSRTMPRQPAAGGPAVSVETDRRDFERQEMELFASEPVALDVALASSPSRPAAASNRLFGSTDDLIRAIILQEVLGPPLSRRTPPSSHTATSAPTPL